MNKEQKSVITEYVSSLSNEDVSFLSMRLTEKLSGDVAGSLDLISKDLKMDKLFSNTDSAEELFGLLDAVRDVANKENKKRENTAVVN
jgi:hypothetical protein